MRNLKKALSLALALVMLLGMMMVGAGAAKFDDVADGAANQEAVEVMAAIDIIKGDENGFRPDDTLNRAEAAVIISKVLLTAPVVEKLVGMESRFTDLTGDYAWAIPYVEACANSEIIVGNGDGTFDPASEVTGVAFAKMLLVTLGFDANTYNNNPSWELAVRQDAIKAGLDKNGIGVISSGNLNRADAAQMAFNAITEYSPSGTKGYVITGSTPASTVVYPTLMEAVLSNLAMTTAGRVEESTATDTLAATRFNLSKGQDEDAYGHTVKTWSVTGKGVVYTAAVPTTSADIVIANESGLNANTDNRLKSLTIKDNSVTPVVDGKDSNTAVTAKAGIASLCTDGSVVEIYLTAGSKTEVESIIVINTYIGVVGTPVEADEEDEDSVRTVPLDVASSLNTSSGDALYDVVDLDEYASDDLQEGDVVLFTVASRKDAEDNDEQYVASCVLADSFDGQMTRRSASKGTLTIDGETYNTATYVADSALTVGTALTDGTVTAKTDYTFYTDSTGKIIAARAVSAAPAETFYAIVDEIVYVAAAGTGTGLNQSAGSDSIEARLVMADGTTVDAKVSAIKVAGVDKTFSTAATANKNVQITKKTATSSEDGKFTATSNAIDGVWLNTNLNHNSDLTGKIVTYSHNEERDTYEITYTATASGTTVSFTGVTEVKSDGTKGTDGDSTNPGTAAADPTPKTITTQGNPSIKIDTAGTVKVANNSTVFVVKTLKNGKAVYTPYIGYKNVESITATGVKGETAAVDEPAVKGADAIANVAIIESDGVATLVYIDAGDTKVRVGTVAAPVSEVIYIVSTAFEVDASGRNSVNVYQTLDGEVSVNTSQENNITAVGLYTVEKTDNVITSATLISSSAGGWTKKVVTAAPAGGVLTTSASGVYSYDGTEEVIMIGTDGKVVKNATVDSMKPVDAVSGGANGVRYNVWISVVDESVTIKTIYIQAESYAYGA